MSNLGAERLFYSKKSNRINALRGVLSYIFVYYRESLIITIQLGKTFGEHLGGSFELYP